MKKLRNLLLIIIMAMFAFYRLRRQLLRHFLRFPPVRYKVRVHKNIRVPMQDGITLATDHYYPVSDEKLPTIMVRSPYGRNPEASAFGHLLAFVGNRFAERGYHVIIQDTRGRFDSPGEFNPYFNEKDDGKATLEWLNRQHWFNGVVGTWGSSYLGIVQWAVCSDAPEIKAVAPTITATDLRSVIYPDGALDLGLAMRWLKLFEELDVRKDKPLIYSAPLLFDLDKQIQPGIVSLPVKEADKAVLGREVAFFQSWLAHEDPQDEFWAQAEEDFDFDKITAPVHLIGGWYDFFLRPMLDDYAHLSERGANPYLTIGPWHHFNAMVSFDDIREGIHWFDAHLKGDSSKLRKKPVRIYVMGTGEWREMDHWPPPAQKTCYYLHSQRTLGMKPPEAISAPDTYDYDPANPTPIVGGTQFNPMAGPKNNYALELRPDVLTYTTDVLEQDVEVIGPVRLQLYVKSSLDHTDFFGRLCDVGLDGVSTNICDGLFRIKPNKGEKRPDGSIKIEIDMWATAHRFVKGHRIRLQVSSGAHPRWNRNLGTGDNLYGTVMCTACQTIYHDDKHPSALVLPVTN